MNLTTRVRAIILVLLGGCCVAMSGCSNPARERMIGDWEASFEMTEADMAKMSPTDNPIAAGIGKLLMKSLRADIQWKFGADDTVVVSPTFLGHTVSKRGTWKCLGGDETTTTVQFNFENDEPREVSFKFLDQDTFEAIPVAGEKWQLNRVVKFKRVVATPSP